MFIILVSVSFCVGGWANDIKKPLKKMIFLRLQKVANTADNTQLLCENPLADAIVHEGTVMIEPAKGEGAMACTNKAKRRESVQIATNTISYYNL